MPESGQSGFASASIARHLSRGALGFGLLAAAFLLFARIGPLSLLLVPVGVLALRGCPMCWTVGLIETIGAGRLRGSCASGECAPGSAPRGAPGPLPNNGGSK